MRTSSCPYIFNCQNAHAANQLLLSPYRMIVVLLSMPLLPRSSSSFLSGMMSRVRVSQSSVVQFQPAAPGHVALIVRGRIDIHFDDANVRVGCMLSHPVGRDEHIGHSAAFPCLPVAPNL